MEIWKEIKDFDNYEISNYGNVKRKEYTVVFSNGKIYKYKERYIKSSNRGGYKRYDLIKHGSKKTLSAHRLVAEAFIPNPENKPCVNHINGIKDDNRIDNLEWVSNSENMKHSYDVLKRKNSGILGRKIDLKEIPLIKSMYFNGCTQREIAYKYNVHQRVIWEIVNNKSYVKHV